MTQGPTRGIPLDTDGTLAANSDQLVATQKATKTYADGKQPLDADLTAIAGLSPSNDDFIQRKAGAWANRTLAQARADLGFTTRTLAYEARGGDGGTNATLGSAPSIIAVTTLADAATQGGYIALGALIPADCVPGSTLSIRILWVPGSTDAVAHTVRWSIEALAISAGVDVTGAGTTTTFTGSSAARTANVAVLETSTQILASVNPGDLVRCDFRRIGADGADTYVGAVNVITVYLDYTATI